MTQHKGEIIVPKVDFERARITTRRASSPKIGAGIGGWIEWQLIDRQGRVVRGGEQHNLFLDQGLNAIATGAGNGLISPSWFLTAVVGVSSTEPSVSDVALADQVSRTTTVLSGSLTRPANGTYRFQRTFEFDFNAANGNLTEWGVEAQGEALVVRELFRDSSGEAIVITKTADYKLRITYACELTFSPITPTPGSFVIDGIGLINGNYMFYGGESAAGATGAMDLKAFNATAKGIQHGNASGVAGNFLSGSGYNGIPNPGTTNNSSSRIVSPFTPGVWERSMGLVFGTNTSNTEIRSMGVNGGEGTVIRPGFAFDLEPTDRFTKDDEHTLTINDMLTVTWGRS